MFYFAFGFMMIFFVVLLIRLSLQQRREVNRLQALRKRRFLVGPKDPPKPFRYAIHPGEVYNMAIRRKEMFTFEGLRRSYGVDPRYCFEWGTEKGTGYREEDVVHLFPSPEGDYEIPECLKN